MSVQYINFINSFNFNFILVADKPVAGKVFAVKVSMVNRSNYARNFTVAIPNKKKKFNEE